MNILCIYSNGLGDREARGKAGMWKGRRWDSRGDRSAEQLRIHVIDTLIEDYSKKSYIYIYIYISYVHVMYTLIENILNIFMHYINENNITHVLY